MATRARTYCYTVDVRCWHTDQTTSATLQQLPVQIAAANDIDARGKLPAAVNDLVADFDSGVLGWPCGQAEILRVHTQPDRYCDAMSLPQWLKRNTHT